MKPVLNPPILTLLVGPSGAGKSTWVNSDEAKALGITPDQVISSDKIRAELCGDFQDQSKNKQVFQTLRQRVLTELASGRNVVIDATNLSNRRDTVALNGLNPVRYVVINRPMEEKYRTGGWRNELKTKSGFDLIAKHEQIFQSQLSQIRNGDGLENVTVYVGGKIDTSSKTDLV